MSAENPTDTSSPLDRTETAADAAPVESSVPAPAAPVAAPVASAVAVAVAAQAAPVNASRGPAAIAKPPSMSTSVPISRSAEFLQFRSSVGRQRVNVHGSVWTYYEHGPKDEAPVLFLHGTSGTAEIFFAQLLPLSAKGYHVISASFPPYWSVDEWINGFDGFLKCLHINNSHVFAWSLGGYLALHYYTHALKNSPSTCKVSSLILCNAFLDTTPFHQGSTCLKMFPVAPEFVLKKIILDAFPQQSPFPAVVDFMVEQLDALTREDVAARLTLNCTKGRVYDLPLIDESKITLIDSCDDVVLPDHLRDQIYAALPSAKQAYIKQGGDFPFLASVEDVNMHVIVHLRRQGLNPANAARKLTEEKQTNNLEEQSQIMDSTSILSSSTSSSASSSSLLSSSSGSSGSGSGYRGSGTGTATFVPISAMIDLSRTFKEEDALPTPIILLPSPASSSIVDEEEEKQNKEREAKLRAILEEEKKKKLEAAAALEEERRQKAEAERLKYKRHNELLEQLVSNEDAKPQVSSKNVGLF